MPPRRGTTAWTRGPLPSDRIRPPQPAQPAPPAKSDKGKGKAKAAAPEPPRSAAVRKLDELLAGLRSSNPSQHPNHDNNARAAAADSGDCFCQARAHALSEYTPLCTACGLILCSLHPPHRPCPHCAKPLLAPPARAALIVQLEEQRAHTLAEEAAAREREVEEQRAAEGAFPALNPQRAGPGPAPAPGSASQHQVLTVDARTKRIKVESYSAPTPTPTRLLSGGRGTLEEEEEAVDVLPRVPPPPREVEYVRVQRGSATRWADLKGDGAAGGAKYVAPPSLPASSRAQPEHARGRGKGKGKGRPPVPGAPAT
ncbi:hypothetical protein BJV78DRAFT_1374762 [Lactifluus subvellereus]|nr:hypothetical protein BJV78DRAFT_1374762 [Lactifluus subvellereus]